MTFKRVRKQTSQPKKARKSKFQADLAPAEDRMVRGLKEELQLGSNTDFLSDAVALFRWAVGERKRGHRIFSESEKGERKELVFPRLERIAPEFSLPRVEISWTTQELEALPSWRRANLPIQQRRSSGQCETEWPSSSAVSKNRTRSRLSTVAMSRSITISSGMLGRINRKARSV